MISFLKNQNQQKKINFLKKPIVSIYSADSLYNNTELLLDFRNQSISDNFLKDKSKNNSNISISTTVAEISNQQNKFDNNSLFIKNYGAIDLGNNTVLNQDNFTIDLWVYITTNDPIYRATILASGGNSGPGINKFIIGIYDDKIAFYHDKYAGGSPFIFDNQNFTVNAWTHIALSRENYTFYLFVNGMLKASATVTNSAPNFISSLILNEGYYYMSPGVSGTYIDNIRVTKGVLRYTTNFTPEDFPKFSPQKINFQNIN